MNINELRLIINEYKNSFDVRHPQSRQNKILLEQYKGLFKNTIEMLYLIENYGQLENLHVLCYCGNKNTFYRYNKGYCKHCSYKCSTNDKNVIERKINSFKKTCLEKYGVDNVRKSHNIIEKIKKSKLSKIDNKGLNSYQRMVIKGKKTRKQKYGNENYNNRELCKKTKLLNIDDKGLNSYQRQKINLKKTCIKKYGVDNVRKSEIIINKIKQIKLKRYGNENYNNQEKIYWTKKQNHTSNVSKSENQCYDLLLNKFKEEDIIRQYKSEQYPYACDFYIKSLDLYIECHFGFFHNRKPFDNKNKQHLKEKDFFMKKSQEINFKGKLKEKYKALINIWTKRDPLKLKTFKDNKLNYKIFYTIKEFNNWLNNI